MSRPGSERTSRRGSVPYPREREECAPGAIWGTIKETQELRKSPDADCQRCENDLSRWLWQPCEASVAQREDRGAPSPAD